MKSVQSETPVSKIPKGYRELRWNGKTLAAPPGWRDDHVFLMGFAKANHGKEKYDYWKSWVGEHWPEPIFFFDRWSELFFAAACGYKEKIQELTGAVIEADHEWWRFVLAAGAGSSGKTSRVAMWMLGNWIVAQEHTSCILTSTSIDQLKRRTWSELVRYISESRIGFKGILEVVASDTVIRLPSNNEDPMNTKSAIFGRAVDQGGSTQAAVDRIKGVHNRRLFCAVDEMGSVPEAITKACRNLKKGTKEFQFFGLANPVSHDDQHGIYCEPLNGWGSITVDDEFWLTAKGGCCIHFDAYKSPGLKEPEKYHFYPNQKDIDEDIAFHGGENDPGFWTDTRGFWSPSGISTTIMDEALLEQFEVDEPAVWKSGWEMGGAFDPAFEGGDRRALYPFKFGMFASGIMGMELQAPIIVSVDASTDVRWLPYAISDAAQAICEGYVVNGEKHPIPPANFIMDTTGEGGTLYSVMSGRWSPLLQSCAFGGAADKIQIAQDRPVTYYELYGNKVTALWYRLRRYIEGSQVRGLSDAGTRRELTHRDKLMRGGKIYAIPKKEMKLKGNRSPDLADAVVIAGEFLFQKGISPAGKTGGSVIVMAAEWNVFADKTNLEGAEEYSDSESAFV